MCRLGPRPVSPSEPRDDGPGESRDGRQRAGGRADHHQQCPQRAPGSSSARHRPPRGAGGPRGADGVARQDRVRLRRQRVRRDRHVRPVRGPAARDRRSREPVRRADRWHRVNPRPRRAGDRRADGAEPGRRVDLRAHQRSLLPGSHGTRTRHRAGPAEPRARCHRLGASRPRPPGHPAGPSQ